MFSEHFSTLENWTIRQKDMAVAFMLESFFKNLHLYITIFCENLVVGIRTLNFSQTAENRNRSTNARLEMDSIVPFNIIKLLKR